MSKIKSVVLNHFDNVQAYLGSRKSMSCSIQKAGRSSKLHYRKIHNKFKDLRNNSPHGLSHLSGDASEGPGP